MRDEHVPAGGRLQMPRSRGAASGFLLILLGIWGALIPFVGPLFNFAFSPDREWVWTAARGWLEVLPGVATAVGGFLLLSSRNRFTAMLGAWLTVFAGAWFVVGRALAGPLGLGDVGTPIAATDPRNFRSTDTRSCLGRCCMSSTTATPPSLRRLRTLT